MTSVPADVSAPVEEIDTPALVVDLDVHGRSLDRMAASLAGAPRGGTLWAIAARGAVP